MNRRQFIQSFLASSGLSLAGCDIPEWQVAADSEMCAPSSDGTLRIDVHCHLLNHDDANGSTFIVRRNFPDNFFLQQAGNGILRGLINVADFSTSEICADRRELSRWRGKPFDKEGGTCGPFQKADHSPATWDEKKFCRAYFERQRGLVLADSVYEQRTPGSGRLMGFASNRLRNAAMMMSFWPNVDIFMPLQIDFFEGPDNPKVASPRQQAKFYRDLNLATRGRFLPLIAYNPRRQVEGGVNHIKALDLVKEAVEKWGFIGVKLHPSTGFNPINNTAYGCPNPAIPRLSDNLTSLEGLAYDRAMEGLFRVCEELDVPILTHGSDSLSVAEPCMHGTPLHLAGSEPANLRYDPDPLRRIIYRKPEDWTNSPQQWEEALKQHHEDRMERGYQDDYNLRVCIAHYASRFQDHLAAKPNRPYDSKTDRRPYKDRPDALPKVEYDEDGNLIPSTWLKGAMERIKAGNTDLWLDLSYMVELCYSEASRTGEKVERDGFFASKVDDGGRYALAFRKHLAENDFLHKQIMYGSDWHMPEVSKLGPSYLRLMEQVLSGLEPSAKEDIMGRNAVRFFGLGRKADGSKSTTRLRLEEFYRKDGLDPDEDVKWMQRVDDRMERA